MQSDSWGKKHAGSCEINNVVQKYNTKTCLKLASMYWIQGLFILHSTRLSLHSKQIHSQVVLLFFAKWVTFDNYSIIIDNAYIAHPYKTLILFCPTGNPMTAVYAIPATRQGYTGYFISTPPSSYHSPSWMSYPPEPEDVLPQWTESVRMQSSHSPLSCVQFCFTNWVASEDPNVTVHAPLIQFNVA